jgi:hypothetical protein
LIIIFNVIKLFFFIAAEGAKYTRVFAPDKPFWLSGTYPRGELPKVFQ